MCNDFNCDKAASVPWNGEFGVNPAKWINENVSSLSCECTGADPYCNDVIFHQCNYIFNEYMCEFYDIERPMNFDYKNAWVSNPLETPEGDLVVAFTFSAFGGYTGSPASINWIPVAPPGDTVICTGCNPGPNPTSDIIVLEFMNTTLADVQANPQGYSLTATAVFLECDTIEKTFDFSKIDELISSDTSNCESMIFTIKDSWHIDGNTYTWDFPGYNALATITNSGRKVEFNTEAVINNTSPTTNPENKLTYTLEVANPISENTLELGGEKEIPECTYGGGQFLTVYPNPAVNDIFVQYKGLPSDEILDLYILDHQFNRVSQSQFSLKGQSLDVSKLTNGLYFLYTDANRDGALSFLSGGAC